MSFNSYACSSSEAIKWGSELTFKQLCLDLEARASKVLTKDGFWATMTVKALSDVSFPEGETDLVRSGSFPPEMLILRGVSYVLERRTMALQTRV